MEQMKTSDDDASPLWQFVPLAQYTRPPEPAAERMRRGIRAFWDRLKRPSNTMDEAIDHKSLQKMREKDSGGWFSGSSAPSTPSAFHKEPI